MLPVDALVKLPAARRAGAMLAASSTAERLGGWAWAIAAVGAVIMLFTLAAFWRRLDSLDTETKGLTQTVGHLKKTVEGMTGNPIAAETDD